ncbi:MAG: L-ribulose-5-phosphate 4-epimerase [Eubacteriales bacterium]
MLEQLKLDVFEANLSLVEAGLVLYTWGNVSALDEKSGLVVIKPSGVSYSAMKPSDMVVVDMDGKIVEGELNPSSDTATHIALYQAFSGIKSVVHTHSKWATSFAEARADIPCLGTTQADNFYGDIPCTRQMTQSEISNEYEKETGKVIVETFRERNIDPLFVPAVIVANHGPFSWGGTPEKAVENSAVMEYVAEMAYIAMGVNPKTDMQQDLIDKHFLRKHGKNAYYGQKK